MLWVLFAVLRATVALVALVIASAVVKTVYVYFEQRRSYAILQRRFKGPVTWPWGGAFERYKAYPRILQMHYNFIQQYGGAAKSYLLMAPIFARGLHGARNEIVTADPVLVKHVLHDKFDIYTKSTIAGRPIRSIQQLLGNGIFIIDHGPHASVPRDGGKMWRQQRRTALQIFSRSLFQNSYEQPPPSFFIADSSLPVRGRCAVPPPEVDHRGVPIGCQQEHPTRYWRHRPEVEVPPSDVPISIRDDGVHRWDVIRLCLPGHWLWAGVAHDDDGRAAVLGIEAQIDLAALCEDTLHVFGQVLSASGVRVLTMNVAQGFFSGSTPPRTDIFAVAGKLVEELEPYFERFCRLISLLKKETSDGVATVDLQSYFFRYTMDAIGHIAFGEQLGNLEFGKDEFGNAFDQAHTEMITCMKKSVPMWLFAGLFPDAVSMLMLRFFDAYCLPAQKAFQKQIAILDKYCYAIIARRRKEYEERTSKTEKPDLLGYFVAAEDDDGRRLYSDKDLRDVIMSFMLAGRDTTACTLSWLFFEISLPENESILEALLSEVDTVLSGTPPTYDSLQDLPYLRGVVWETLRLHPVVPLTVSHSQRPDTLPDGTEVPVGTTISVQSYTMGRDKDRWGDDADEFRPERWIPFKQPSPYEFPQFKAGPRICLGKDMALYEASIVTIIVLQSFRPVAARTRKDIVPSQKATICCHDVTSRKDELWTHLHRREPPTGQ
eukprot:gene21890-33629_t